MRISRLYVNQSLAVGLKIQLDEAAGHYVRTVLRLKKDQQIVLFNGKGGEYIAEFNEVSRKRTLLTVKSFNDRSAESNFQVSLGLGISRGDKMDWAIQKAVELGVNSIRPLFTERCVVKLTNEKRQQRLQHWRNISQHAAEQSGRTLLPDFHECLTFNDWLTKPQGLKVFLDPHAEQSLRLLQPTENRITLLSGPEGGFSDIERSLAMEYGFIPIRLGQRILRTETAALAALTAVQTLWGDFR